MNYELIHDITAADVAVRVRASDLSQLFIYGAEALMSEMVEDIASINPVLTMEGLLEGSEPPLLYFEFLNEFLFFKDAQNLLLLPSVVRVSSENGIYSCRYALTGEKIRRETHQFRVDIKAVTLHGLRIYEENGFYIAESVFDV